MNRLLLVDDTTGKWKRGPSAAGIGGFVDQDFDVGVGGQTTFTVTQVFTVSSVLDVWVNGRKMREGATNDFQRNTSLNTVIFNSTILASAWVAIRVYP